MTHARPPKHRLTWRKQPFDTGLLAAGKGPRGAILRLGGRADGEDVARVYAHQVALGVYRGWFWVARSEDAVVPLLNTCNTVVDTLEEAKSAALAYVKKCLRGNSNGC